MFHLKFSSFFFFYSEHPNRACKFTEVKRPIFYLIDICSISFEILKIKFDWSMGGMPVSTSLALCHGFLSLLYIIAFSNIQTVTHVANILINKTRLIIQRRSNYLSIKIKKKIIEHFTHHLSGKLQSLTFKMIFIGWRLQNSPFLFR